MLLMKALIEKAPRFLFFTGKGGVGKTSMACAVSVGLAQSGKQVLLISTDPASNLDEVLETPFGPAPCGVRGVSGLWAMNINPIQAAAEYRRRMVDPYRGVLPDEAIRQMEEQLSGACTVEIAGFNEFSRVVGDESLISEYDHVVLDTAPTGHTLRLLNLPSAWNDFIATNQTGSSCLGPVSGLSDQKSLYQQVVASLKDPKKTLLVLVSRAEAMSFREAARASIELQELGLTNQHVIVNGLFDVHSDDSVAKAFSQISKDALDAMPKELAMYPKTTVSFRAHGVMGLAALESVVHGQGDDRFEEAGRKLRLQSKEVMENIIDWERFLQQLESQGHGVIMTMGKGGVGKTTMAAMIASELAQRGHTVLLSTTDPAAHIAETIGQGRANLHIDRIDPKVETARHVKAVLDQNRQTISSEDLVLLEEELRSPCTEEIAVFKAFAKTVARGHEQFIVLDTAPTGHTLLLIDSSQAYHRQVAQSTGDLPPEVEELLPRMRDSRFTKVLIVTTPEATPTHEAAALQADLQRAGIDPFAWIINRSFAVSGTTDPTLCAKGLHELAYIKEIIEQQSHRTALSPWIGRELAGPESLSHLKSH
jgi:arsenite-transporting ATPase